MHERIRMSFLGKLSSYDRTRQIEGAVQSLNRRRARSSRD
jgi:hypothetical protein